MNNSGVRSAVRVIRLDEFVPKQPGTPAARAVDELEPEWSSLPPLAWPDPIGSAQWRAPVSPPETDDDGLDGSEGGASPTVPSSVEFGATVGAEAASTPSADSSAVEVGKMPRLPNGVVTSWPLRFQGDPTGYARLWVRNVLLIVLTCGLYLPWARVRSQRYLMRHTKVAGHVLDYHEPAVNLLPRYALSLSLLLGVGGSWAGGSSMVGMLSLSLALAVWPMLVFMSLSHRMAHLSWAHRRLAFDGTVQQAYRAMWAPLFGGGVVVWLLLAAVIVRRPMGWMVWGSVLALWLLAMPAFVWTWYVFRQRHLRMGPLHLLWKATKPAVMMLFLRTVVWAMLATVFSLGVGAMLLAVVLVMRGKLNLTIERGLMLTAALIVCAAVQPYAQARLQNLVWNKSGNRYLRFRSKLSVADFVVLQGKHALLLVLTLGLYWPWAVIATRRMRAHSLTIWSRVDAEVLKAHWPVYEGPDSKKIAQARLRDLKRGSKPAR